MSTKLVSELAPGDVIAVPSGGGRPRRAATVQRIRQQSGSDTVVAWLRYAHQGPGVSTFPRVLGLSKTVELADA